MSGTLHLVARVGDCGLLFDAGRVDSVVEVGSTVPAPGAAPAVIGLAAMRSRVATVIDVRPLFGGEPVVRDGRGGRAVATLVDGHLYAIAVDALEDVATFNLAPAAIANAHTGDWDFVTAVAEGAGETLLAVDIDRLVARASGLG
ncbi:purine-binding chemotaxis protein CheW [Sphingomonas sp. BE138]|uniref:chemotaxis protein CheW n=1 Tax=Sphingomonas sp. BE138 TaxID=2817845 RepID=UPI002863135C|nr:chemotaxis protein CheW [Sphingomonas sp. BE138]MDR6789648.1 purine-binding chemotaxis protein CheW [Sphingomonas sp. BE138]